MAFAELGNKFTRALSRMTSKVVTTDKVVNDMVEEIENALIEADVNVKQAKDLKTSVLKKINALSNGENKRREAQRIVHFELWKMLNGGAYSSCESCEAASILCSCSVSTSYPSSSFTDAFNENKETDNNKKKNKNAKKQTKEKEKEREKKEKEREKEKEKEKEKEATSGRNQTKKWAPIKGKTNVVMFVGLQGAGKTTTCMKYAHYYKDKKNMKVGLICADTFRAGAFDQLKQNALKVGVHYYGSYVEVDPAKVAKDGLDQFLKDKFDLIIVDTSGRHKQQAELFVEMEEVAAAVNPDHVVFVMDGSMGQAAYDQARAFRDSVDVGSVIVTKLDGHTRGGGALCAVALTSAPICFIGTGERMQDFEPFDAHSFASRLMGMGDMRGLLEQLTNPNILEQQKKTKFVEKLKSGSGIFTVRDMYEQMQVMTKLGDMGKLIGMIPGLKLPAGVDPSSIQQKFKCFGYVIDSMHSSELDSDIGLFEKAGMSVLKASRAGSKISKASKSSNSHKKRENATNIAQKQDHKEDKTNETETKFESTKKKKKENIVAKDSKDSKDSKAKKAKKAKKETKETKESKEAKIAESRIMRISRGSGQPLEKVMEFILVFRTFQPMVQAMISRNKTMIPPTPSSIPPSFLQDNKQTRPHQSDSKAVPSSNALESIGRIGGLGALGGLGLGGVGGLGGTGGLGGLNFNALLSQLSNNLGNSASGISGRGGRVGRGARMGGSGKKNNGRGAPTIGPDLGSAMNMLSGLLGQKK